MVLLVTLSAFFLDDLPLIGAGVSYRAEFGEAAGLTPDNEVRIAGVKVGKVTGVVLAGDRVRVTFRVRNAWVGDQSTASIQIKTALGQKYLAIDPRGSAGLHPGDPIPLERTVSPYDVIDAFSAVATTFGEIDTPQLAASMETLSEAFSGTPAQLRASLDGVTRLSQTIATRDQELRRLFDATAHTSAVLADRNAEFTRLIGSAGLLLSELNTRQQAIATLLTGTQRLSRELTGLVRDNEAQIGPALAHLRAVVQILQDQNANLDRAIKLYAPFTRVYANVVGNGRWFDQVAVNLTPPGLPVIPGNRPPVRTLLGGH